MLDQYIVPAAISFVHQTTLLSYYCAVLEDAVRCGVKTGPAVKAATETGFAPSAVDDFTVSEPVRVNETSSTLWV